MPKKPSPTAEKVKQRHEKKKLEREVSQKIARDVERKAQGMDSQSDLALSLHPEDLPAAQQIDLQPVSHVMVGAVAELGSRPVMIRCPACGAAAFTRTRVTCPSSVHIVSLLLCLCGLWPCAIATYCFCGNRIYRHFCAKCELFIGEYIETDDLI